MSGATNQEHTNTVTRASSPLYNQSHKTTNNEQPLPPPPPPPAQPHLLATNQEHTKNQRATTTTRARTSADNQSTAHTPRQTTGIHHHDASGASTPVDKGVDEEHDVTLEGQVRLVRHEGVQQRVEPHPLPLDELEVVHRGQDSAVALGPVHHQNRQQLQSLLVVAPVVCWRFRWYIDCCRCLLVMLDEGPKHYSSKHAKSFVQSVSVVVPWLAVFGKPRVVVVGRWCVSSLSWVVYLSLGTRYQK